MNSALPLFFVLALLPACAAPPKADPAADPAVRADPAARADLAAPGSPYGCETPVTLVIALRNGSPREVIVTGFGTQATEWNAETVNIDLIEITRDGDPTSLYIARPRTQPPMTISGMSGRRIRPGGTYEVAFDARKWVIRDGWTPGVYRVRAALRAVELDERTIAMLKSEWCEFEITAP